MPEHPREATEGAIVVGPPPIRLQQELSGRYRLSVLTNSSVVVIGQAWRIGLVPFLGVPLQLLHILFAQTFLSSHNR